jgi:opacity protein-like surface antigen
MFAAACVAAASAAHALPLSDRTSFEIFAGGNVGTSGSFRRPMRIEGPDNAATNYDRLDFEDVYRDGRTAGAEFDYNVDSHVTAYARAAWSQFTGQTHEIGSMHTTEVGFAPIDATFGDANSRELNLGARYNFSAGEKWRPFVGAALGATRMSDTHATVEGTRVELGKANTAFMQRIETGLQYSPKDNFDLRLTAAASHTDGGESADDPNLALLGLDSSNSSMHAHWSYPAELGAVWHF